MCINIEKRVLFMIDNAILLAGGKSRRMGRDKALIPFCGNSSLVEYQYRKLEKIFKNVHISTKDKKFDFPCNMILDKYKQSSPLVAIVSALEELEANEVFILSVDTPFVDDKIIGQIVDRYVGLKSKPHALLAQSPSGLEPLCGIYSSEILPYAKNLISLNRHRLKSLIQKLETQAIYFEEGMDFLNINTPQDYDLAIGYLQD